MCVLNSHIPKHTDLVIFRRKDQIRLFMTRALNELLSCGLRRIIAEFILKWILSIKNPSHKICFHGETFHSLNQFEAFLDPFVREIKFQTFRTAGVVMSGLQRTWGVNKKSWDWYIYLYSSLKNNCINVGKYPWIPMGWGIDGLGFGINHSSPLLSFQIWSQDSTKKHGMIG